MTSPFVCGAQFVVAGERLKCERAPGHLGGHASPSVIAKGRLAALKVMDGCRTCHRNWDECIC